MTPGTFDGVRFRADGQPLRAAVLSVGSELLLGDLTDSNATWLSLRLRELGVEVIHHLAVRDDLDEFVDSLQWLAARTELVIVGGGLGPTVDDLTREAVAVAAGVVNEHHPDLEAQIAARFASMDRPMAPQNLKQARIPAGATPYPPVGTAPAFGLTLHDPTPTRVIALPGVPWEMRELFARHVEAEVLQLAGKRATVTRVVHVVGRGESDVAAIIEPLLRPHDHVTLSFLATSSEIQVRLTVSADDPQTALLASQPVVDEATGALGPAVVGVDEQTLEQVVLRLLGDAGQTVATAESVTAGSIAARLGHIPGASAALLGGVVAYATEVKRGLLEVPGELLRIHGPVSAEVTEALAAAVQARTGADWGIAVTGVAGPDPLDELPAGTGFWALAHPDGHVEVHERQMPGDRGQVIARLGSSALDLLRRRLRECAVDG